MQISLDMIASSSYISKFFLKEVLFVSLWQNALHLMHVNSEIIKKAIYVFDAEVTLNILDFIVIILFLSLYSNK